MLRTRLTEMFGLQYPLMSAPMALHSGATLAAAVSNAGGLGSFGGLQPFLGPDWLRGQITLARKSTDKPFAVGFITAFIPVFPQFFDIALEERVPVIALSFGSPAEYVHRAKESGAKVICQAQHMEGAREAASAGADVIVAQGNEAGGHTGTMNLLPLLAQVIEEFPGVPVLAAGGVSSGRALAAVLAAGADGAWAGTAFLATPECVEVPDAYKQLVVESTGADTVWTRVFDVLNGLPWPAGIGARVRRNRMVDEWDGREDEVVAKREELGPAYNAARDKFDAGVLDVYMGQGVGAITSVRPAAEVLRSICDDAEAILRERAATLLA
jgi:nitronate monooxygenase